MSGGRIVNLPDGADVTEGVRAYVGDTLHVYTDGYSWVIAASPEDASAVLEEFLGEDTEPEWVREPDGMEFTYVDNNWSDPAEGTRETHTMAEWARLRGRGYLACSDY